MNDSKLLKIYLDTIGAKIRFCSGGLISIKYINKNDCDIYDSYVDMLASVKYTVKEWKLLKMEGLENVKL